MIKKMRILVLEDDIEQADLLRAWLESDKHQVHVANEQAAFFRIFGKESFDLVILDWMLPSGSGLEVLRSIRGHYDSTVPVVFMTQRDAESDIVSALEAGADDYIVKPLPEKETLARVRALGRRFGDRLEAKKDTKLVLAPYTVDIKERKLYLFDQEIDLTQKEYELALFMFQNIGQVISRGHMLEMIWATNATLNTRTVDTHVSRVRNKLELDQQPNWRLTSIYRHGYRIERIDPT